jgi:hypothetical protein
MGRSTNVWEAAMMDFDFYDPHPPGFMPGEDPVLQSIHWSQWEDLQDMMDAELIDLDLFEDFLDPESPSYKNPPAYLRPAFEQYLRVYGHGKTIDDLPDLPPLPQT